MGMAVRALGLLVGVLIVGIVVEPHVVPTSSSVAQGMSGGSPNVTTTPFAPAVPILVGTIGAPVGAPVSVGNDEAAPTATPPFPLPTESRLRCPDPEEPVAPNADRVIAAATPIPLYQPVPYSTGEFVAVSNTNEHGANLRVAPRALARILRVVPEGEVLETVGGDLKIDRIFWTYVRDEDGTVGWIVSHMLTGVARVPGRAPLPYQALSAAACATFTPTPTPIVIPAGATGVPGPAGAPAPGGSGGGRGTGTGSGLSQ